jgi:tetratricopeptide (TPR) repeat protein
VHRRYWVDLDGYGPGSAEVRIAQSVGADSFAHAMHALGDGQPALLVLDNADQAFREAPAFDPVLGRLAACVQAGATVIVTTRSVAPLLPLDWDATLVAEVFSAVAARQLFDALAPAHAQSEVAEKLLAPCEGLPLAVSLIGRLAAARSDLTPLVGSDLSGWHVGGGGNRRNSIAYAVAVAGAQMDADERVTWAALSCFPAGLGDTELQVLGLGPFAVDHVMHLYRLGIAVRAGAGWRVPEPLRLDSQSSTELWQRYASASSAALARGGDRRGWLIAHQANLDRLAEQHPPPDGLVDLGCDGLLAASGAHDDGVQTIMAQLVETAVGQGPLPNRVTETIEVLTDHDQAKVKLLAIAAEVHRRNDNQSALADTLRDHGGALLRLARYGEAEALLVEAQAIYDRIGNKIGQADARRVRGQVARLQDRYGDAEALLVDAQAIYDPIGSQLGQAGVRQDRGRVATLQDRYGDAEALLVDAQAIYDRIGDEAGQANARLARGEVARLHGRYGDAEALLVDAQAIYDPIGSQVGQAHARRVRGEVARLQGRYGDAEALLVDAQAIYERIGEELGQAHARLARGEVAMSQDRYGDAEALLVDAQAIYDRIGNKRGQATARQVRGELYAQADHSHGMPTDNPRARALTLHLEASDLYRTIHLIDWAGRALAGAARSAATPGERSRYASQAIHDLEQAGQRNEAIRLAQEFGIAEIGDVFISTVDESTVPES